LCHTIAKKMIAQGLQFERGSFKLGPLSYDFSSAGLFLILGKNGAGKSSLLKLLCGRLQPKAGSLLNRPPKMGTCGLETVFPLHWSVQKSARWFSALSESSIEPLQNRLPFSTDRSLQTLSSGQRRFAELSIVLSSSLKDFLLDEPFQNLDAEFRKRVADLIREQINRGARVWMTGHSEAEFEPYALGKAEVLHL
jgi:ABC-2 type transport system ATP-binding protein